MDNILKDIIGEDSRYSFGIEENKQQEQAAAIDVQTPVETPVDTEVKTEEPIAAPVDVETPTAAPVDVEKITDTPNIEDVNKQVLSNLNERLGTQYSDLDAFKNDYSQIGSLRESEKELKEKLIQASNPFGDDTEMAELFGFRKETNRSIDDFHVLKNIDLSNTSSLEIMVADAILNNPSLRGKDALVKQAFEKKYNLVDVDEEDIASNRVALDIDSTSARQRIEELQSKIKSPEFPEYQVQQTDPKELETQKQEWEKTIPQITQALENFNLFENPDDQKNGKEPITTIKLPKEVIDSYVPMIQDYIAQNRIALNDDSINQIYGLVYQDYVVNNHMAIAKAYSSKKIEENNKMWQERTGVDVSKLGQDTVPDTSTSDVDRFNQEQLSGVLDRIGVKRKK